MYISMDIHGKSVNMDTDTNEKFHIHGKPDFYATADRPTAITRLSNRNSVCLSVCLSVTRVIQSKTMQARITKSLPSGA